MREGREKILATNIEDEMRMSYIDYAMSVIVARALPDVRDGLKPIHQRIIHAMNELHLGPGRAHSKSAKVIGEVMGKYHPHGDQAIYDAMVRMAQPFALRYPLVDGQGNFGSLDGDPPAAQRYTEVRLTTIAQELLQDIDKDTVDFRPNYDESEQEPVVLPSAFPNLLANGSTGIAVGMATNIPPHNLCELIDALVLLIEKPKLEDEELLEVVHGPDFPTGAIICGREGIRQAYLTGRGKIYVRARAFVEQHKSGKESIIIGEIPYQVNKARLIEEIAKLVQQKRIEGIADLRDESDKAGIRVVIELKRGANPTIMLNQLYKNTQMQTTYGIIMLALVDQQPRYLRLRQMLDYYLDHRREVVTRRTQYDLDKAERRAHILEGYLIALDNLDAIIKTIRSSDSPPQAREQLIEEFDFTKLQAQAILDLQLHRLTGLERKKIKDEYTDLIKQIEYLRSLLANPPLIMQLIKEELVGIREKYGDERRTEIIDADMDINIEDMIAEENVVVTVSHTGYIKRTRTAVYRSQKRGGRGVAGMDTKEEDFVEHLFTCTTLNYILFFTDKGTVHWKKVYEVPQMGRYSRGKALVNFLELGQDERVTAMVPVESFEEGLYVFMTTRDGVVKKAALTAFSHPRRGGIKAITLDKGDRLEEVRLTNGQQDIIIGAHDGKAILFSEQDVRPMGRTARGVKGIVLAKGDYVVGMEVVRKDALLFSITENGYGKRTPITEYRYQKRGGKGVINIKTSTRNGKVVGVKELIEGDELMVVTEGGIIIRVPVDDKSLRAISRNTQGVRIIRLDEGDKVVALARVQEED